jgi:N-acetyl-gamma-glutamyl-phosphate reductase
MRIGIIGATGYVGLELLRLLAGRAGDEVVLVTSRQEAGQKLTAFFPALAGLANYDDLIMTEPVNLAGRADFFLMAAQHGAAMSLVPELLSGGARVVDLSADFRLKNPALFEKWYSSPHTSPELLDRAVYGLPELYGDKIKDASLVANPGCYPTSVILALAPAASAGLLEADQVVIVDAKSGVTGAGRTLAPGYLFVEVADNFRGYKIVGHRHTPEMIQELSLLAGFDLKLSFTPHLLPINRGILSTVYLRLKGNPSVSELREKYINFYKNSSFIRVRPEGYAPETADVRGTNFCDLGLFYDQSCGLFKIISVIDNICRGAGGQAIANLNLMTGRPVEHGLILSALRP